MRYVDEFRDEQAARHLLDAIRAAVKRPCTIMEICGGQTHTLLKYGILELLPPAVTLVHGPGCPVCVTPVELIEQAFAIARRPEVIFTSFGDMLRVPGTETDLLRLKAAGADVRIVYSPLDAVKLAQENPNRQVVFFAVGFETTAPANAMALWLAKERGLANFSLLSAHVLVPPAMQVILDSPDNQVQAFLAAGHVCTVMGYWQYEPLAVRYRIPIVVTGFEPIDLLQGILMAVRALEERRFGVENQYSRSVRREGNLEAQLQMNRVFAPCDRAWRGIGVIPQSGFQIRAELEAFDAAKRFELPKLNHAEPAECMAGQVLQGRARPTECAAFGSRCTPEHPLGAPMVSSEGACAAYFRFASSTRAP